MTRPDEAGEEFRSRVLVTRQSVSLAKEFILQKAREGAIHPPDLIEEFAAAQGHHAIDQVNVDSNEDVVRAARYHSHRLAIVEAVTVLTGQGLLLPSDRTLRTIDVNQRWVWMRGNSSNSSSWTGLSFTVPERLILAPSLMGTKPEPLTDPDLYVLHAGIEGAHEDVEEALRDAIECFRQDLFRPSVTMLAKAMEGAWIELGTALAGLGLAPEDMEADAFVDWLQRDASIARKIERVLSLYSSTKSGDSIRKAAQVTPGQLRGAAVWSDSLRETRNAIHFGVKPTIAYNYEGVAVLLISASTNLRTVYRIKAAADSIAARKG